MVDALTDEQGKIISYAEWAVDAEDDGELAIWIKYLWIHEEYRKYRCIKMLTNMIRRKCKNATVVYWMRYKYNHRLSRYKIEDNGSNDSFRLIPI